MRSQAAPPAHHATIRNADWAVASRTRWRARSMSCRSTITTFCNQRWTPTRIHREHERSGARRTAPYDCVPLPRMMRDCDDWQIRAECSTCCATEGDPPCKLTCRERAPMDWGGGPAGVARCARPSPRRSAGSAARCRGSANRYGHSRTCISGISCADAGLTTMSLRALQRRVRRMEEARKPRPSPIVVMFGSFDNFVAVMFQPAWDDGSMDQDDILDLVSILRGWETDGTWSGHMLAEDARAREFSFRLLSP